jgi:multicomponent K+:H+ antiporter subunit C
MMELLLSTAIGAITAAGVYLALRSRTFELVLGLTLISYAVNLFIFAMGRPVAGRAPILREGVPTTLEHYTDPLPQALVLTAIVISFAMTAVLIVVALKLREVSGGDHVDGGDPAIDGDPAGDGGRKRGDP